MFACLKREEEEEEETFWVRFTAPLPGWLFLKSLLQKVCKCKGRSVLCGRSVSEMTRWFVRGRAVLQTCQQVALWFQKGSLCVPEERGS